jgi:two-component system nitrate/nitrite response regulator NarL
MTHAVKSVSVVVVEDHPLYRYALGEAFRADERVSLGASFADGRSALAGAAEIRPDVALVDVHLPDITGLDVLAGLCELPHPPRVVFLSADGDGATVYAALAAGATGYLSKALDGEALCAAVVAAADGEVVISRELQRGLSSEIRTRPADVSAAAAVPSLTTRELEILAHVAEGMSAPQIGEMLYLSTTTVKTHLANIYSKLGVSDRAAAVAQAIRRGVMPVG